MSDPLILPMPPRRKPRVVSPGTALLGLLLCAILGGAHWLFSGRVEAQQGVLEGVLVPVPSPMTAVVTEVLVPEGTLVQAGQPLARLDNGGYRRQEADARALVRGARPPRVSGMEDAAARVAEAQAAEEYTVRRVALARHEEEAHRQMLERSVMEHVQAELRMRGLDAGRAPSTAIESARKTEQQARQRKEESKAAFESASRTRAAVENELALIRRELEKARSGKTPPETTSATRPVAPQEDPSVLLAPQEGRVVGSLNPGQMLVRGEPALRLAPAAPSQVWATVRLPQAVAATLHPGMLCVLRAEGLNTTLLGEVHALLPQGNGGQNATQTLVRLRITDAVSGELAARLPGTTVDATVWTRSAPGLPWLARYLPF